MSGRAGRRGLDDRGVVILMADAKMEPPVIRDMVKGAPDLMWSEFHLGYNMLLNMMRLEGGDPQSLMRRSFRQFQTEHALPALERKIEALGEELAAAPVAEEAAVELYLDTLEHLVASSREERALVTSPRAALPFLQPGRLVEVCCDLGAGEAARPGAAERVREGGTREARVWGSVVSFEFVGGGRGGGKRKRGDGDGDGEPRADRAPARPTPARRPPDARPPAAPSPPPREPLPPPRAPQERPTRPTRGSGTRTATWWTSSWRATPSRSCRTARSRGGRSRPRPSRWPPGASTGSRWWSPCGCRTWRA